MKTETKIVIIKESLLQSILSDVVVFGILVGSLSISHLLVGSAFLDSILIVLLISFGLNVINKNNTYGTVEEAIKYLEGLRDEQ